MTSYHDILRKIQLISMIRSNTRSKKYNEIQLTKNIIDLNNLKMKIQSEMEIISKRIK